MADLVKLAEHVRDSDIFELPFQTHIHIPQPFEALGLKLHLSKFMVLELVVAVLMLVIFIPLARRIRTGDISRGRFWNMFEAMLLFVRDKMVRPAIGHDADRFLPFIWTLFFFILFCNLLGLLPWTGSPTGDFAVTSALALIAFGTVIGAGMKKYGMIKFWTGLCPPMDLPFILKIFLVPMILFIEIFGLFIKHTILAVRLLANMFAGHIVLAVVVAFTADFAASIFWYGVMPASVLGGVALCMLELLVAFIQDYIFAFLTALFIGMAVHQH
ncbi:MAG: F0F1 ATP synthase subunit A [Thermoguttaceae bacterium]